jgi:hypothetical protein
MNIPLKLLRVSSQDVVLAIAQTAEASQIKIIQLAISLHPNCSEALNQTIDALILTLL